MEQVFVETVRVGFVVMTSKINKTFIIGKNYTKFVDYFIYVIFASIITDIQQANFMYPKIYPTFSIHCSSPIAVMTKLNQSDSLNLTMRCCG